MTVHTYKYSLEISAWLNDGKLFFHKSISREGLEVCNFCCRIPRAYGLPNQGVLKLIPQYI